MRRVILIIAVLLTMVLHARPSAAAEPRMCFTQTGFCIEGRFLEYWQQNGGLPVFGYPVGESKPQLNRDLNREFVTQWFERARFELHPENQRPYDVLLGRLGDDRLRYTNVAAQYEPKANGAKAGCLWFAETQHNVCDQAAGIGFKTYWQNHGLSDPLLDKYGQSLQLFGLPLTEPRMETNTSGDTVMTQWFERARFEWHPNNPNDYKVLLGLLGKELFAAPRTADSYPESLIAFGDSVIFSADDGINGRELWRSNGDTTVMLKDIYAGSEFSTPVNLTNINNKFVVFDARDASHGNELWRTDGTGIGTTLIKDINPGTNSSSLMQFTPFNNGALFVADDGVHGLELWRTDGTPAGTVLVKDVNAGANGMYPSDNYAMGTIMFQLTVIGNRVYFFADDGVHGSELWMTDGTTAGTTMVADLAAGRPSTFFDQLVATERFGLVFSAWDEVNGDVLWRTDGTAAGTIKLARFNRARGTIRSYPPFGSIVEWNTNMYFGIYDGTNQLWRSNGTAAGTQRATTLEANFGWNGGILSTFNGALYAQSLNPATIKRAVNESDVTTVATMGLLRLVTLGQRLYGFDTSSDGVTRLFASNTDGTNFTPVATFVSTSAYSGPTMAGNNERVFISVADEAHGIELWTGDARSLTFRFAKDINTLPR